MSTLYWLTKTAVSSARLYWESKLAVLRPEGRHPADRGQRLPRGDLHRRRESWVARRYPHLIHYNRLAKGGHFAAWEQPEEFVVGDARRRRSSDQLR